PAIRAAQQVTKTVPIVMLLSSDPVQMGLVSSLARPGGNTTGLASAIQDLAPKRVELLKQALPSLSRAIDLCNPANPAIRLDSDETERAARLLEIRTHSVEIKSPDGLKPAFEAILRERPEALIVVPDPLTVFLRAQIVQFAAQHRL